MISKNQQKLIRQLEQKKYRQREGLFVAEGPKVVGDLIMAGNKPAMVFATKEWETKYDLGKAKGFDQRQMTEVTTEELRRISFLQHPQYVLALFPLPCPATSKLPSTTELALALDGIQDPGNLGTIIRVADWFGINTIYCSEDTTDAWSPKTVQATMGSIARVNLIYLSLESLLKQLPASYPVYGTQLDGNDIYRQTLTEHGIIVMGNEGNGISAPIRQLVNRRLLIPNFRKGNGAESLNVAIATAITCSEFRRR